MTIGFGRAIMIADRCVERRDAPLRNGRRVLCIIGVTQLYQGYRAATHYVPEHGLRGGNVLNTPTRRCSSRIGRELPGMPASRFESYPMLTAHLPRAEGDPGPSQGGPRRMDEPVDKSRRPCRVRATLRRGNPISTGSESGGYYEVVSQAAFAVDLRE